MATGHWWIRLCLGCVFLEPLNCGLSTVFLNIPSYGSIIDFSFLSRGESWKEIEKERERLRVCGEWEQISAPIAASSSPSIRLIKLWWFPRAENHRFVSHLLLIFPAMDEEDTGCGGVGNSGECQRKTQGYIPPCPHPHLEAKMLCFPVPLGPEWDSRACWDSWGRN